MAEHQELGSNPYRELAWRVFITLLLGVVVYRLGVAVPIPGVNQDGIATLLAPDAEGMDPLQMALTWANMLNGGAIGQASVFGVGIMPYISASIIMQLLAFSIPALKALQKEGETGRRKINQFTRYATLGIAVVQACIASIILVNMTTPTPAGGGAPVPLVDVSMSKVLFVVQSTFVITTGSMLLLWISEQITKFGIGNGVSIIIMVGILSAIPGAFRDLTPSPDLPSYLTLILVAMAITAAIVLVVVAIRKVHLEQQRRVQGNKIYGGGQTTLPMKLNQANVIPVIFAAPVLAVFSFLLAGIDRLIEGAGSSAGVADLFQYGEPLHRYLMASLIIGFTFFYISITFDLNEMSNNFKQSGFFIRGIKPGKNTVDHLAFILKRITLVGAVSLALISLMPETISHLTSHNMNSRGAAVMVGGTGLMIVVGVTIDVMQKIATFFLAQQYQGLSANAAKRPAGNGKRF